MKTIKVYSARNQLAFETFGADDERECDTLKQAKAFAKYSLSDAYMQSGEMSEPFNYSVIVIYSGPSYDRTREVHSEYYRQS